MKKMLLVLSLFFTASLANAAGGPIPGVDVSLEQIPGGTIPTQSACLKKGGKIIHKRGKTFCKLKRVNASKMGGSGPVDDNGDFTLKHEGRTGHGAAMKKMSGSGATDNNGDFTLITAGGGNTDDNSVCSYHTQRDCIKNGGSVWNKNGKYYCVSVIKTRMKHKHKHKKLTVSDEGHHLRNSTHSVVKFKAGSELATKATAHPSTGAARRNKSSTTEDLLVDVKSSPSHFSTGSRGTFKVVVKNKGTKLAQGMLKVVDRMPSGLSVKTGNFRAGSWRCKGGMVSSSGQDVTCTYNRTLAKKHRATLNLNVRVASKEHFPADVKEVENCATASVEGVANREGRRHTANGNMVTRVYGPGDAHFGSDNARLAVDDKLNNQGTLDYQLSMTVKACDKVKIRHTKSGGSFHLPISIGIGLGGFGGGGGSVNKGAAR